MEDSRTENSPTLFDIYAEVNGVQNAVIQQSDRTYPEHGRRQSTHNSSAAVVRSTKSSGSTDQKRRRKRYQWGTLELLCRKSSPDVWIYRYSELIDGERRRPRRTLGTVLEYPTEADALRACEHLRMQANSEYPRSNVTMRGLIGRYIEEVVRPSLNVPIGGEPDDDARLAYASAIAYESQIRNHIQPAWEKYPVKPEVQALVENWLRSLRRSPNRPNGLAPQSLAHIRGIMHAIFKFAVKWGYLRFNPLSDKRVELPRGCSKRLKPPVQINPSQFLSLIDNLHIREKAAVSLDGELGTRVGEPFGLKWEDLDLHAGTVNFSRGFSQGRVTHLKTEASRANLPLPDDVVEVLRQWYEKTPYKRPGDWVFASPFCGGKRPFSPRTLMNHIQPVARALGLPHIGWHTLRHSFCAWAKAAGLQIEDVKTLTRHQTTKMPSEIYGRPEIETTRVHQNRVIAHMKKQAKKSNSKERKARRLEVNGLTLI